MSKTKGALFIVTGSRGIDLSQLAQTLRKNWDATISPPPFPSKAFTSLSDKHGEKLYGYDTPKDFIQEFTCFRVLGTGNNPSWGLNTTVINYLDGRGDVWVPVDLRPAKSIYRQLKEKNFNTSSDKGKNWYYVIFQKDEKGNIDLDTDPEFDFPEFDEAVKRAAKLPSGICPDPKINATAFVLDNPVTAEQLEILRKFVICDPSSAPISTSLKFDPVHPPIPPIRNQPPGGGEDNSSGN